MKKILLSICALACAATMNAQSTCTPLTVKSGFNTDCLLAIKSDKPTEDYATGKGGLLHAFDGSGSQFMCESYFNEDDCPAEAKNLIPLNDDDLPEVTDTTGVKYIFGDPLADNCLYFGTTSATQDDTNADYLTPTEATVEFETPAAGNGLGILVTGSWNGDDWVANEMQFEGTINYTDGSTTAIPTTDVNPWGQYWKFDENLVFDYSFCYRFSGTEREFRKLGEGVGFNNIVVAADATKQIKSVTIKSLAKKESWGFNTLAFFAFTAINGTDGINSVVAENNDSNVTYNTLGQQVAKNTKGIVIRNGKKFFVK